MIDKKIVKVFLMIIATAILWGCAASRAEYKSHRLRQKAERNTPPFTPAYFKQKERRHMAVFFDIVDGTLTPSRRTAEIRPGRMPYRSATTGNVLVIYKAADGKELGRYAIEDPVLARSCDFDSGKTGELKPIERGTIEILLPYNPAITTVEIGRIEGKLREFDFGYQIREGLKGEQ